MRLLQGNRSERMVLGFQCSDTAAMGYIHQFMGTRAKFLKAYNPSVSEE
jgi:hypothetical protein